MVKEWGLVTRLKKKKIYLIHQYQYKQLEKWHEKAATISRKKSPLDRFKLHYEEVKPIYVKEKSRQRV